MLKAIVSNIEEVEERYRDLYTQRGDQWELTGVEGMKTQGDVDRLSSALTKERNDHKVTKNRYAVLGDRDPNEILTELDRIPELEAAASGNNPAKVDELVEARIRTRIAPLERERDALGSSIKEKDSLIADYMKKEKIRGIRDAVVAAASKDPGMHTAAIEDALTYAESMMEVDENGRVITREGVGVTPGIDPSVWLTEMQPKRPHWWKDSQGGGASGNRGGFSGMVNPWTNKDWNVTEQGKIHRENPEKAQQMAKSAGTSIGGLKPPPGK